MNTNAGTLRYRIVVHAYDILYNMAYTFHIQYPMYTISYVDTMMSYVQHMIR